MKVRKKKLQKQSGLDIWSPISAAFNSGISFDKDGNEFVKEEDFNWTKTRLCTAVHQILQKIGYED